MITNWKRWHLRVLVGVVCMIIGIYGVPLAGYFGCYMVGLGVGEVPDGDDDA